MYEAIYTIKLQNGTILENCRVHREYVIIEAKGGRGSPYMVNFKEVITQVWDMNGLELSEYDVKNCQVVDVYFDK